MSEYYLYGAAVQGIQEFIFKTGKLKEIVGASEIVEQICTSFFKVQYPEYNEDNLIIGAAGNIKYLFEKEADCKKIVRDFPRKVMELAPGITISQAVVKSNGNLTDAINELERKLKEQRNKVPRSFETGYLGLTRSRRTGGVGMEYKDNEALDEATVKKQEESSKGLFSKLTGIKNPSFDQITFNIEDIVKSNKNNWIAVVHADGNGLGSLVQKLGNALKEKDRTTQISTFRDFSKQLESATTEAAQAAFELVIKGEAVDGKFPIRPIILGGDDITFVIRGDLAMKFTELFLREFEIKCSEKLAFLNQYIDDIYKLTACAGIAYVKDSYPFHYGVDLADKLCKEAKSFSKDENVKSLNEGIPPSSISFFVVQDSFVESELKVIRKRTQSISHSDNETKTDTENEKKPYYHYGPYLLNTLDKLPNTNELRCLLEKLAGYAIDADKSKAVSKLRQLISESFKNTVKADFMKQRFQEIDSKKYDHLNLDENFALQSESSILYDLLQLHAIEQKDTKNN